MVQPLASVPPLLSAAAWLRGDDPVDAWERSLGHARILAEGCDGTHPAALADRAVGDGSTVVDESAADDLDRWLDAASHCTDGGWGPDVDPWVQQLRSEAGVARTALQVLRGSDDEARSTAPLLMLTWPRSRTLRTSVLGGRGGVVPGLAQTPDGEWSARADAFVAPDSLDRLSPGLAASLPAAVRSTDR